MRPVSTDRAGAQDALSDRAECRDKVYDGGSVIRPADLPSGVGLRVLDVGCGSGRFAETLSQHGYECYGITISSQEAALAKDRMKRVIVGDAEQMSELPFPAGFFDIVIFSDVLEHLREPRRALELIKPYVRPGGSVVASIPNVANLVVRWNLLCGRFTYEPSGILDNTHVRFYTKGTAQELLESAGFMVQRVTYTNWNWRLPRRMERLFAFCEWEVRQRMTRWWPGLFATQFILHATYRSAAPSES